MDGFTDGAPFSVAVSWLGKDAQGNPREVPLLNARTFAFGLLAETLNNTTGVTTRWLVPWSSVIYVRQDQPMASPGQAPTPPAAPVVSPPDPPAGR